MQTSMGLGLSAVGRRFTPWWHRDAWLAADFKTGRAMLGQKVTNQSGMFEVSRASPIILPNLAGTYSDLGSNTLPRTDRGLYANAAVSAPSGNNHNILLSPWSNFDQGGAPVLTDLGADGILRKVRFQSTASNSRRRLVFNATAGQVFQRRVRMSFGTPNDIAYIFLRTISPVAGNSAINVTSGGVATVVETFAGITASNVAVANLGGGVYELTYSFVSHNTATVLRDLGGVIPGSGTCDITFHGDDIVLSSAPVPVWVSNSEPVVNLLASDIRALQGTRPSNGEPEPFPGYEARGMDVALRGISKVQVDRLSASTARFIAGAGLDANNLWKVIFDTDNRFKLIVRKAGVDVVILQTGVVGILGLKEVTWTLGAGDYEIAATGVAGAVSSSTEALPEGSEVLRVGSDFSANTPFRGWIEWLEILRAEQFL